MPYRRHSPQCRARQRGESAQRDGTAQARRTACWRLAALMRVPRRAPAAPNAQASSARASVLLWLRIRSDAAALCCCKRLAHWQVLVRVHLAGGPRHGQLVNLIHLSQPKGHRELGAGCEAVGAGDPPGLLHPARLALNLCADAIAVALYANG